MTIGCNIWMICLKLNWFLYGLSRMLQFSKFVWPLSYSVWDVFNNFLLTDATDRSKISSDQKRFFIALSLYPLTFFANTPFKTKLALSHCPSNQTIVFFSLINIYYIHYHPLYTINGLKFNISQQLELFLNPKNDCLLKTYINYYFTF